MISEPTIPFRLYGYFGPKGRHVLNRNFNMTCHEVYRNRPNMHRYAVVQRHDRMTWWVVDLYEPELATAGLPAKFPVWWEFDDLDTAIASAVMRQAQE